MVIEELAEKYMSIIKAPFQMKVSYVKNLIALVRADLIM